MIASQESLGAVKLLLDQAATLCRRERKKLLLYFISMALAELATEMGEGDEPDADTRH